MDVDDVRVIAVLGAGNMGHGIAEVAALAGYEVRLRDISEELVERGYDQIEWSLGKLAEKSQISDAEAEAALDRIDPVVDLAAAAGDADLVVEAVPERRDVKREVYAELEDAAPDRAVFATNTSSLSVTELASVTERPGRFCGMHFFNPPVRMELVEVVAGAETDEATLALVEDVAESLGKTPVRVAQDAPGFVVNRVLVPLTNEAAWLVHADEATVAEVDATATFELGLPMGVFELADQVGLDVALHVLEYLHQQLGAAYEPCPLLAEKVEAGDLGKKSGTGFYDHENGGVEVPADAVREDVAEALVAAMADEVAALVDEGVADADAVDRAMRLGAGFPDGPARMADDRGLDALVATLDERREVTGAARYEVHPHLRDLASAGESFRGATAETATRADDYDAITVERDGAVGRLVLDRPHRLNTITGGMLDELGRALDDLEDDDDVRAVLLTGAGDRAFSAGADVQSVAAGGVDHLSGVDLARRGQSAFERIESSPLPVVAAVAGYCLGGGMELAAAADLRIASADAEFGQTEHNLGLMPGWGGTQRLPRLVGEARAKEILFTADRYDAETLLSYGFLTDVVPADELAAAAADLASDLAAGPPIAQRATKRAIHAGRDDRTAGLEVEAQAFGHLLGTDDLMEGVTAFMSDEEPEFEGT
jgi:enoyl-CoA hydratase/3-hydroxyacyl-CoA dehydrogenase